LGLPVRKRTDRKAGRNTPNQKKKKPKCFRRGWTGQEENALEGKRAAIWKRQKVKRKSLWQRRILLLRRGSQKRKRKNPRRKNHFPYPFSEKKKKS